VVAGDALAEEAGRLVEAEPTILTGCTTSTVVQLNLTVGTRVSGVLAVADVTTFEIWLLIFMASFRSLISAIRYQQWPIIPLTVFPSL
jgi:hypothetical protein